MGEGHFFVVGKAPIVILSLGSDTISPTFLAQCLFIYCKTSNKARGCLSFFRARNSGLFRIQVLLEGESYYSFLEKNMFNAKEKDLDI